MISLLSFLILAIWVLSLLFLAILGKTLSLSLLFSKENLLVCLFSYCFLPSAFFGFSFFFLSSLLRWMVQFSSVQFSRSVVSDSLRPHESQHTRPPCLSPTPGVYSNSCPSSRWCHPAISSSVAPFSSCPQSLPASGSFPMSQLFARGGQSTGVSVRLLIWGFFFFFLLMLAFMAINFSLSIFEVGKYLDIIPMADSCWALAENSKIL